MKKIKFKHILITILILLIISFIITFLGVYAFMKFNKIN